MQISPRYDGPAILRFDPIPTDPSVPMLRQRRRLASLLATLDEGQWAAPSRCDGWTCRDVVSHLVTVSAFWAVSVAAGRSGEPTRFLDGFDPVATPAQLVEAAPLTSTAELLDAFSATTDSLAAALDGLDAEGWTLPAEAPPGHLALDAVVLHALWDGWIHERDIALPLGFAPGVEPDEVAGGLRYAVGLGPAFLATTGSTRTGSFAVRAEGPDVDLVVEVGPVVVVRDRSGTDVLPTVAGGAVELLESFSLRSTPPTLPGTDGWMVEGLGVLFDQAG
jgi:uncharacterized protein (TIGR03083 family)